MLLVCRCSFFWLVSFVLSAFAVSAQSHAFRFTRLNSNSGLSQDHVSAILKDRNGFMWFATDEGLNKYDGYKFIAYKHDPGDKTTISSNYVLDLLEDQDGNLWIATTNGLDQFRPERNSFVHFTPAGVPFSVRDIFQDSKKRIWIGTTGGLYLFDPFKKSFKHYESGTKTDLSNNFIYRIAEGQTDELWIATRDGLNRFLTESESFTVYRHNPADESSIGANRVKSVYRDRSGNIWVGTQGGGVSLYNRNENTFTSFLHNESIEGSISHNDILSFSENAEGKLWIGTENGGISIYDDQTKTFQILRHDPSDQTSLSNNSIYSIYRDDIGNMWVGTWSGGANLLPRYANVFENYKHIPGNSNSLSSNLVLSITGDSEGNLWIGTDGGGLNFLEWKSRTFKHYRHSADKNSLNGDYVLAVSELKKGVMGIGYHRRGFDIFDRKRNTFTHYMPGSDPTSGLSVHVIFEDRYDNLWVGSYDRSGLYLYDRNDLYRYEASVDKYTHYSSNPNDENSIGGNIIYSMFEDRQGALWVGTNNGLELFDAKKNRFTHHRFDSTNNKSISNNVVYSILEDRIGNLWLGTGGGGLNHYDKTTGSFTSYTEKNGLSNNVIYGILEDKNGNLWLSSNRGLTRFNPTTKECRNFTVTDGLQGNSFKPNACFKSADGEMFFGGTNGLTVFKPEDIKDNPVIPPVWITDFKIFASAVPIGENSPLKLPIGETQEITLSHDQSMFTFEFAALNYTSPEKNQYAYKLEDFDKTWNFVGTNRSATYTNLDAGQYEFKVKASNNDGLWNEQGRSIKITITPPFWQTLTFRTAVIGASLIIVLTFYRLRIASIQKQKSKLKRQVKKRTQEIVRKNEEINAQANEIKTINENLEMLVRNRTAELEKKNKALENYAYINAHKLRGPLASILGLVQLMVNEKIEGHARIYLDHLKDSAEKLDETIHAITAAIEQADADDSQNGIDKSTTDIKNKPFGNGR